MSDNETNKTAACCCTLKWFNESKGFGFLVPDEKPEQDAFVHVSCLQKLGIQNMGKGARFSCVLKETENGLFVEEINNILDEGDLAEQKIKVPLPPEVGETYELKGVVKWYREDKGFGFVAGQDGMKDIFIHQTCLRRNGIEEQDFEKGAHVIMSIREVDQGREAVTIALETRHRSEEKTGGSSVESDLSMVAAERDVN